jgi:hypothetical protein
MAVMAAVWTVAVILSHHSSLGAASCAQILLASGSMLPLATLFFVELATERSGAGLNRARWFVLPTSVFFLLSFTPLIVRGATRDSGIFRIAYGVLHPAYVVWALIVFAFAAKWLILAYRRSVGQSRLQAGYLLLAFMIPIIVGTFTNLLIPLFFKSSSFGKFGPYVSLVMIAMIGHAIIRHRLMDIRVKVRRGVVYLAAVLVAGLALLMLLVVSNTFFHDEHQAPVREILLALLVAVLFAPLKGQIQRAFDRYLYREPYDYQRTIRETSRALSTTIDLPTLLGHFARTVAATLRPEGLAIYLLDEEEGRFERAHLFGQGPFPPSVAPTNGACSSSTRWGGSREARSPLSCWTASPGWAARCWRRSSTAIG